MAIGVELLTNEHDVRVLDTKIGGYVGCLVKVRFRQALRKES